MKVLWWARPIITGRAEEGAGAKGGADGAEAEAGADEGLDGPGGAGSGGHPRAEDSLCSVDDVVPSRGPARCPGQQVPASATQESTLIRLFHKCDYEIHEK